MDTERTRKRLLLRLLSTKESGETDGEVVADLVSIAVHRDVAFFRQFAESMANLGVFVSLADPSIGNLYSQLTSAGVEVHIQNK